MPGKQGQLEEMRSALAHGVGLEKKKYLSLSRKPAEAELMRVMMRALAPAGILNPGKLLDVATATR